MKITRQVANKPYSDGLRMGEKITPGQPYNLVRFEGSTYVIRTTDEVEPNLAIAMFTFWEAYADRNAISDQIADFLGSPFDEAEAEDIADDLNALAVKFYALAEDLTKVIENMPVGDTRKRIVTMRAVSRIYSAKLGSAAQYVKTALELLNEGDGNTGRTMRLRKAIENRLNDLQALRPEERDTYAGRLE